MGVEKLYYNMNYKMALFYNMNYVMALGGG